MSSIRTLVHSLILALCFSSAALAVTPPAQQVNINTADSENKTAYSIAVINGHVEIAKLLMEDRRFLALFPTPDMLLGNE